MTYRATTQTPQVAAAIADLSKTCDRISEIVAREPSRPSRSIVDYLKTLTLGELVEWSAALIANTPAPSEVVLAFRDTTAAAAGGSSWS